MAMSRDGFPGIGMTSARTRDRLIQRLREQGISNEAVLERIASVPRHIFVDEALASRAYEDTALPLGFGQTISQPFIVALMTQALLGETGRSLGKVLEIGSGCGYQTAVLAGFAQHVFAVERIGALVQRARANMRALDINNVSLRHGDGFKGWSNQGPFDAILVAAAPHEVPEALLAQLEDGASLVIPIGPSGKQDLVLVRRQGESFERRQLAGVTFVPMLEGIDR
jgi:protein-L-isoaspartate(D-aspartate) O-methyltransferase